MFKNNFQTTSQQQQQLAIPDKVLMQVNKYVHPCERFPTFIKLKDRKDLESDYKIRENERIKDNLELLDRKIYELFFGNLDGSQSRLKRYKQNYLEHHMQHSGLNEDDVDSEQEEELAYDMFVEDIKELRDVVIKSMHQVLVGQVILENKFANEREFFSVEINTAEKTIGELREQIV